MWTSGREVPAEALLTAGAPGSGIRTDRQPGRQPSAGRVLWPVQGGATQLPGLRVRW